MALAAFLEEYPMLNTDGNRRRRNRPGTTLNLLDFLDNQLNQKIGHDLRRLTSALLDSEDDDEFRVDNGRKRKRKSYSYSLYEPKTKAHITTKDNKFQVLLDTSNYQPEELSVKIIDDKITVSAKHESKGKDVYEYHEMTRSFNIPDGVDPQTVTSRLSAGGQLTIEAPVKPAKDAVTERVVPVEMVKDPQPTENSEDNPGSTDP